jgi:hypothetical protein
MNQNAIRISFASMWIIFAVICMIFLPREVKSFTLEPIQMGPKFCDGNFELREFVFQQIDNFMLRIGPFGGSGVQSFEFIQENASKICGCIPESIVSVNLEQNQSTNKTSQDSGMGKYFQECASAIVIIMMFIGDYILTRKK